MQYSRAGIVGLVDLCGVCVSRHINIDLYKR